MPVVRSFMEALGSIMENKRSSNQDPDFNDRRLQKEMFLKVKGVILILSMI
jgi:hypothetical protein